MKRKFNFTGRKKISRANIKTFLRVDPHGGCLMDINIDIQDLNLPPASEIYIELYKRMVESKVIKLGVVNGGRVSKVIPLGETIGKGFRFRIFAVDPTTRRILAHADRISLETPGGERGILESEYCDLGNEVWRVDFEGEEGSPILKWNRKIPGIHNLSNTDPVFIMMVAPATLREILTHMVFIDGIDSIDDPQTEWHHKWLKYARIITGQDPPPVIVKNGDFTEEEARAWINRVVEDFCNSRTDIYEEFIRELRREEGEPL